MKYRTRQDDVLDDICKRFYGRESAAIDVLIANPGLADRGPIYPSGVVFDLPDLPPVEDEKNIVRLWD